MRVSEEPVCIYLFRQNPVYTSLHLRSPIHVVPPVVRALTNRKEIFENEKQKKGGQLIIMLRFSLLLITRF